MASERKCLDCGTPLPAEESQPVCPRCIFKRLARTGSTIYPPESAPTLAVTEPAGRDFHAEYELLGGGWQRLQTWISEVNKVKPEDINRVSRTYLKNFHFAVAGNPKEFDKDLFLSR